jgi:hypothetical protein
VHAAVLLAALWLLTNCVRARPAATRWTAAALAVFFFTDVGYVAPFNSFYSQVAALLFCLLTFGIAAEGVARGGLSGAWLAAFFVSAALFVAAKPQESLHAPLLAVLGWRLASRHRGTRRTAAWAGVALCAFGVWYYAQTPRRAIKDVALFHTVFMEILPKSPDPAADLDALGLDRALLRYRGMNAYLPEAPLDDPAFRAAFYDRFRVRNLVLFYAARPGRMLGRAREGARQAFMLRTPGLGNFEAPAPPRSMDRRFGRWSDLRKRLDRHGLLWMTLLLGGNLAFAAATWRRAGAAGRLLRETAAGPVRHGASRVRRGGVRRLARRHRAAPVRVPRDVRPADRAGRRVGGGRGGEEKGGSGVPRIARKRRALNALPDHPRRAILRALSRVGL